MLTNIEAGQLLRGGSSLAVPSTWTRGWDGGCLWTSESKDAFVFLGEPQLLVFVLNSVNSIRLGYAFLKLPVFVCVCVYEVDTHTRWQL